MPEGARTESNGAGVYIGVGATDRRFLRAFRVSGTGRTRQPACRVPSHDRGIASADQRRGAVPPRHRRPAGRRRPARPRVPRAGPGAHRRLHRRRCLLRRLRVPDHRADRPRAARRPAGSPCRRSTPGGPGACCPRRSSSSPSPSSPRRSSCRRCASVDVAGDGAASALYVGEHPVRRPGDRLPPGRARPVAAAPLLVARRRGAVLPVLAGAPPARRAVVRATIASGRRHGGGRGGRLVRPLARSGPRPMRPSAFFLLPARAWELAVGARARARRGAAGAAARPVAPARWSSSGLGAHRRWAASSSTSRRRSRGRPPCCRSVGAALRHRRWAAASRSDPLSRLLAHRPDALDRRRSRTRSTCGTGRSSCSRRPRSGAACRARPGRASSASRSCSPRPAGAGSRIRSATAGCVAAPAVAGPSRRPVPSSVAVAVVVARARASRPDRRRRRGEHGRADRGRRCRRRSPTPSVAGGAPSSAGRGAPTARRPIRPAPPTARGPGPGRPRSVARDGARRHPGHLRRRLPRRAARDHAARLRLRPSSMSPTTVVLIGDSHAGPLVPDARAARARSAAGGSCRSRSRACPVGRPAPCTTRASSASTPNATDVASRRARRASPRERPALVVISDSRGRPARGSTARRSRRATARTCGRPACDGPSARSTRSPTASSSSATRRTRRRPARLPVGPPRRRARLRDARHRRRSGPSRSRDRAGRDAPRPARPSSTRARGCARPNRARRHRAGARVPRRPPHDDALRGAPWRRTSSRCCRLPRTDRAAWHHRPMPRCRPRPRARRRGDPRGPDAHRPRLHRPRPSTSTRACPRASASRSSSRSRRSTRSARSRAAGRGSSVHALAGEGRIGPEPAGRRAPRPATSARASAYAARALGVPAVVFCSTPREPRPRSPGCGPSARRSSNRARTSTTPAAPRRPMPREHGAELLVDGDDPRISTGAATLALEVTDAVEAGLLPALAVASVPVGNGALINGVGSWLRHAAPASPRRRHPGRGAPRDDPVASRAGRPIDTDRRRPRTPTASPRGSRSRVPSSSCPAASTTCSRCPRPRCTRPRPS